MAWRGKKEQQESVQCSLCPEPGEVLVRLNRIVQKKYQLLMEAYPNQEWFSYLVGEHNNTMYYITDLIVPPHAQVNSGMAEAEPFTQPENCVGTMHSHHHMGAFHSGTDNAHVDSNFPVNITIAFNRAGATRGGSPYEFDTVLNVFTPCHRRKTGKVQIELEKPAPLFDYEGFIKQAIQNVGKANKHEITFSLGVPNEPSTSTVGESQGSALCTEENCPNVDICTDELKSYWKDHSLPCQFSGVKMPNMGDLSILDGKREKQEKQEKHESKKDKSKPKRRPNGH